MTFAGIKPMKDVEVAAGEGAITGSKPRRRLASGPVESWRERLLSAMW